VQEGRLRDKRQRAKAIFEFKEALIPALNCLTKKEIVQRTSRNFANGSLRFCSKD
jgi:hypothetical protein